MKQADQDILQLLREIKAAGGGGGGDYILASAMDTDGTLAANSDGRVATQKATKTYVDAHSYTAPYLVYTALLTQSGGDAPVATVLQNTLGGTVVWSYQSVGVYIGTLNGAFAGTVPTQWYMNYRSSAGTVLHTILVAKGSSDTIQLTVFNNGTESDDDLNANGPALIEVKVWP